MSAGRDELLRAALTEIAARCPRLVAQCYWAGTSAISLEELGHRESFDLDFHTRQALADTRPLLAELEQAFPGRLELISPPDAFGSGFSGLLELSGRLATAAHRNTDPCARPTLDRLRPEPDERATGIPA